MASFNSTSRPELEEFVGAKVQSGRLELGERARPGIRCEDSAKGVPPDTVEKLRKMFGFLDDMGDPEELRALAAWKVHTLTGDRKGTWSLSVARNRRLVLPTCP